MRLHLLPFLAGLAAAAPALAQPGGGYEPPPVEYATPADRAAPLPPARPQAGDAEPAAAEDTNAPPPDRRRGSRGPGRAQVDVGAYVEADQVVSADLSGGGGDDVLTYTSVAAGVEGQVASRRVAASAAYRYERRIDWNGDVPDQDVHTGIAQLHAEAVPGTLALDAGALATRTGGTGRAIGVTDRDAGTQIYGAYVGPSLSARAGPVALNASYRLGYTHVDDDSLAGAASPEGDFDSTVHSLTASAGMAPGVSPVGWTVAGGYVRENSGAFDNRFEASFVRGDVVAPVGPTVAVTAGIGYSRIRSSQQDVQRGPGGAPVRDARGRFIPNPSAPRLLTYDSDGIFYDAGVIWRPNPRTEVQVRAGADQDGNFTVAGSAATQFNRSYGATLTVFDHRETFGQSVINNIRNLPTRFEVNSNPLTGNLLGGCVFGNEPGRGACFAPALQSISNATFRARGASLVMSGQRRLWSFGLGAAYTHRDFYLPDDPLLAAAFATKDQDFSLFAALSRELGRTSSVSLDAYASWYSSTLFTTSDTFNTGVTASYRRAFLLDRLQLIIALGLAHSSFLGDDSTVANGLIGLRYTF